MSSSVPHRHLWSPDRLSSADLQALLDATVALKRAKQRDPGWGPLRGRHLALLTQGTDDAASAFARAVHELGGTVTLLDAHDWLSSAGARIADAARMLGRLYDAIDCCGLAPATIEQIDAHCGVPVFNGLARSDHPINALCDLLTMREASGKPLRETRLQIAGDAAMGAHAATVLARLAGVQVQREAASLVPEAIGAAGLISIGPDFILDVSATSAQARLVRADAAPLQQAQLSALLADNRVRALQAAIVCGIH